MYNCNREYLSREELYGTREERKKNEIIRLMRHYKDSIPKPIKLNKDKSLDMRFKKNQEWYSDTLSKEVQKCKEKNAQYTYQIKPLWI